MARYRRIQDTHYDGFQLYGGAKAQEGFSTEILNVIINMVEASLQRHSQVLMVVLQFNFPAGLDVEGIGNDCFQSFVEAYKRRLTQQGLDPEYLWVRETGEINNRSHYHLLLLLDGNMIRYFGDPFDVRRYWLRALQQHFAYEREIAPLHVQTLPQMKRGVQVRRDDPSSMEQAVNIASYLAKIATKGACGKFTRTYSSSRFQKEK